jgi:hypothetical protein
MSFEKKKRSLLRKAMELSVIFKKDILVSIMDDTKLILYSSSKRSCEAFKSNMMNPMVKKDIYTNDDVLNSLT